MYLRLGDKLLIITAVPLAFILVLLYAVSAMHQRVDVAQYSTAHSQEVMLAAQSLSRSVLRAQSATQGYALTHNARLSRVSVDADSDVREATQVLMRLVNNDAGQATGARNISLLGERILASLGRVRAAVAGGNRASAARAVVSSEQLGTQFDTAMRRFVANEESLSQLEQGGLRAALHQFKLLLASGALIGCLLTFACMIFFSRTLVRRLSRLSDAAARLAATGELSPPSSGQDELAQVDRAFHDMAQILSDRQLALAKYRLLAQHTSDAMFFVRQNDLKIIEANEAAQAMYGYSREELLGRGVRDLRDPSELGSLDAAMSEAQHHVTRYETRNIRKDGSTFPVEVTAQGALIGGERVILGIVRDITARQELERDRQRYAERALETSRLKSQFLANMSHEIRTPMNGVIGMTELLLSTPLGREQVEFANAIRESGEALLAIINEILDFSRLEAHKVELEISDFSPGAVAESVADLLASQARQRSLAVQAFVSPEVPRAVRGDAGRVRQILMNLVGNAIKFTDQGRVTVRVTKEPSADGSIVVKFAVTDTGIGIPESARSRLFEPFVQGDGSSTREAGGSGLGLTICKRLVELMNGDIGFVSEAGAGSTFWFSAPFAASTAVIATNRKPAELAGHRALIVDDDPIAREIIHAYIVSWGMRNGSVAGGPEALEILREAARVGDPYDVAIIDFWMPPMNGLMLAQSIRADTTLNHTKLILLSGFDSNLRSHEALRAGFDAFLAKPVKQSQLFESIASAVKHGEAELLHTVVEAHVAERLGWTARAPSLLRVLVAEDNVVNQKLTVAQLKRLNLDADVVHNGQEAVSAVKQKDYALVLMDCQMPGMDGFEAARQIRDYERGSHKRTVIVAVTANALEGDREGCIAAGMDDYVSKPVQLDRLRALVHRWLPRPDAQSASA